MKRKLLLILPIFVLNVSTLIFTQVKPPNSAPLISLPIDSIKANIHERSSYYDLIVKGTVVERDYMPLPRSEAFHSNVVIKVDSILKGTLDSKRINIKQQSGPINKDTSIFVSIEPRFRDGEEVIMFLNIPQHDLYLNSPYLRKTYKTFNGQKSLSKSTNSFYWASDKEVFEVKNDTVNYFGNMISISEFISTLGETK
jgi:hypothetical protein